MKTHKQFLNISSRDLLFLILMSVVSLFPILIASIPLVGHFNDHPCQICGAPAKNKKESLYTYGRGKIPKARLLYHWYCDKHAMEIPFLTDEKNIPDDSIGNRLFINFVLTFFGAVVFGLGILTMNLNRAIFIGHPATSTFIFLIFGPTHKWTSTLLGVSIFTLPGLLFVFWYFQSRRKSINK